MEANNINCICPICGGELQARGKALFKEHHKRLWKEIAKKLGVEDTYEYSFGKFFYNASRHGLRDVQNKPAELIKWEQENPIPKDDLTDCVAKFITGGLDG